MNFGCNISDSGVFAETEREVLNENAAILIDRFSWSGEIFHGGLATKRG